MCQLFLYARKCSEQGITSELNNKKIWHMFHHLVVEMSQYVFDNILMIGDERPSSWKSLSRRVWTCARNVNTPSCDAEFKSDTLHHTPKTTYKLHVLTLSIIHRALSSSTNTCGPKYSMHVIEWRTVILTMDKCSVCHHS